MGILDKFRNKNSRVPIVFNFVNNVERAIMSLTPDDLYDTQDALQAVVDFIARSIASTSLKVYRRDDDDDRARDRESTTAKLLARPNDHMTTYDLISILEHELELHRECHWLTVQDPDSPSGWVIEPIRRSWIIDRKTDGFKITDYYIQNPVSGTPPRWVSADDLVSFTTYETGLSNLTGGHKSPVDPLKTILREQINAWAFRNQVWDNHGRMTAYLARPQMDAESDWTEEQRDRFVKAWKERWAGNNAPDAGGLPLLEDGMKIESIPFNARETQFEEALKLARESVAGLYHVNPAMIWSGTGQTYASVKENARSLYVDCLGPEFVFITQRINQFLVPLVGDDPDEIYVEFDVYSKLSGNFEEQASVFSTLCGAPCMSVNEIRKRLNLPPSDDPDADKLVKPLNVVYGGQPSPQTPLGDGSDAKGGETSAQVLARFSAESLLRPTERPETVEGRMQAQIEQKEAGNGPRTLTLSGDPSIEAVMELSDFLRAYFKRQAQPVEANINRERDKGRLPRTVDGEAVMPDGISEEEAMKILHACFDFGRWNDELTADLIEHLRGIVSDDVLSDIEALMQSSENYSAKYVETYVNDTATNLASVINAKTYEQLKRAVFRPESFSEEDAKKATVRGVFEDAQDVRASELGQSVATQIRGWSRIAAVHLSGMQKQSWKIWRNSGGNVRPEHAALNGERIRYANPNWEEDEDSPNYRKDGYGEHNRFSNGCRWPGDFSRDPHQVAGCKCNMEIQVTY